MNLLKDDVKKFVSDFNKEMESIALSSDLDIVIFPSSIHIEMLREMIHPKVKIGIQNISKHEKGAYTGEISVSMAQSYGCEYVLIGHSERRQYHNETNEKVKAKLILANTLNLKSIVCIGESLDERENGKHFEVIAQQLAQCLSKDVIQKSDQMLIAYEPVWAIGTGKTATQDQAQEMHAFIRSELTKLSENNYTERISILYGGSCNESNAASLFSMPDIDGGLIGGASLSAKSFLNIIKSAM